MLNNTQINSDSNSNNRKNKNTKRTPLNVDNSNDKFSKKFRLSFRGSKKEKKDGKDIIVKNNTSNKSVQCDIRRSSNSENKVTRDNKIINVEKKDKVKSEQLSDDEKVKTNDDNNVSIIIVRDILENLVEDMWKSDKKIDVKLRSNKNLDKTKIINHRRTSITDLPESAIKETTTKIEELQDYKPDMGRRDSLYSVEEYDENLDENENKLRIEAINPLVKSPKQLKKKNSFFNSLFRKKPDAQKKDNNQNQHGLRRYSSSLELSTSNQLRDKTLDRSIKRKLSKIIKEDTPALIKRSFSVRDVNNKRKETNLNEMQWKQSLQSLVENDNTVSYDDMSFINYDTLNAVNYDDENRFAIRNLHRTQSLIVHGSPANYRPSSIRGASVPRHYLSNTDITEQNEAQSLPSLNKTIEENEEEINLQVPQSLPRFNRRPQSLVLYPEDGKLRTQTTGSFRSASNGCAKLKRTNACRQKSRNSVSSIDEEIRYANGNSVRSRSLNHLDTLEMRYGAPTSPDTTALKDSRSEPDCTKPLLIPPETNVEAPTSPNEIQTSKRHVLSRSQKSSSECFSVNFEVGDESTWDNELFFPATRGTTLHDSLTKLCEIRNIDLSNCDVWLQDKENNTNTLLHFSQDTASLVGRHIRITAKETGTKAPVRKYSGSTRQKSGSFFGSSTEDNTWTSHESRLSFQDTDGNKKQGKQRWSGLFGYSKDTKMEALVEHLNSYTKHGVPTSQIYPQGQCESLDALYKLELDWRELIDYKELTERQQQQQTALWELIKTEVAYIKTLKVVTELFLACLKNLQLTNLLKEIDTEKLFSNITEILDTNVQFWRNSLFPMVKTMRQYKQPPCIEMMAQGFLGMKDSFQAYYQYCAEQARCQHYCRENHAHNELFTAYLAWCETQKECNRLRLMDILVQPMQRLTKYGLLLKAILKNTDEEVEKDTLYLMIRSVDDFVNKVNSSLKQKQDNERLRGLIVRIESYEIVESKDDDLERILKKSYVPLDLTRPMLNCPVDRRRHLLLEGDLKLKDSNTSKMEVHCFLLTDMLLVCKPSTKRGGSMMRVIRQPYLVDRLVVHELNKETPSLALIYKNEFDMAIAGFILQNNDARKLKSWKDGIAKAQSLYSQAKQVSHYDDIDPEYSFTESLESDFHNFQLAPKSPLASSSRASRVSSLAHSHSGSVEMNDQSSIGSGKDPSRAVSVENENRTASISSDEGVQPLPPDRSPVSQKNSFKQRLFNKTPNTLSVQPYTNLGQSLPNLTLGSPNVGTLSLNFNQNTLSVPNAKNPAGGSSTHLLSPTHRGISYPPPSPTRGNLRRGLAISQSKNPPLQKTRHVSSQASTTSCGQVPSSFDFDVPVIAGISDHCESFSRGQLRQAMVKRGHRTENKRYHTAGTVDDIKRFDNRDPSIHKRLSWNYGSQSVPRPHEEEEET
nr:pleckstrin homology domain-containing family G member 5 isoform X1 [Onthophagus taurus]XP_022900963.1 pleckstrin homology domain-containing family G member 5 isoform X1 [Onthophagus taurus]